MSVVVSNDKITISDYELVEFYNKYKYIDIIKINKQFINIIKNMNEDIKTDNVNTEILNILHDIKNVQKTNFVDTNKNINNIIDVTKCNMVETLMLFKNDFIENIKLIINSGNNMIIDNNQKIIEKNNDILYNKLENFLYTKINDTFKKVLETEINIFYNDIKCIIPDLIVNKIFTIFDKNFNTINNLNDNILEIKYEMIKNNISNDYIKLIIDNLYDYKEKVSHVPNILSDLTNEIKSKFNKNIICNEDLLNNITTIINNNYSIILEKYNEINNYNNKIYNNSAIKGKISEDILYNILIEMFPSCNIEKNAGGVASNSGDFILSFDNDLNILIENKLYTNNVNTKEVQKFKDDVKKCKMCGIMLSQKSGIANISDFCIEMDIDNNILIYLHNVEYSKDKILLSINIIKSLYKLHIDENNKDNDKNNIINITYRQLDFFQKEYENMEKNNKKSLNLLEEYYINQKTCLNDMKMNNMKDMINKFYVTTNDNIICKFCSKPFTQKGIKNHMNKCNKRL